MKFFFYFCFLFFVLVSFAAAEGIEILPVKDVFNPGETVQARIFVRDIRLLHDFGLSNFVLLDSSGNTIPVAQSIIKINDKEYYTYFDMPVKINSSYSFGVRDIQFFSSQNILKKDSFYVSLSTNSEATSIAIRPAYFSALNIESYEQPTISFFIRNKGAKTDVSFLSRDEFLVPTISRLTLDINQQKQVEVKTKLVGKLQDVFEGNVIVQYSNFSYNIPIYITRKGFIRVNISANESINISENISIPVIPIGEKAIEYGSLVLLSPSFKEIRYLGKDALKKNDVLRGEFRFLNSGNFSLEDVAVRYKGLEDIFGVDKNRFDLAASGSEMVLNILINASNAKVERYKGELFLIAQNGVNFSMPFDIEIKLEKKNETLVDVTPKAEMNITPGIAEQEERASYFSWIVVIVVIIVIAAVIYYLYKKGKPKQQAYERLVESFRQRR